MPNKLPKFETQGLTWAERAHYGELSAVIDPYGTERTNRFLHSVELFGARIALTLDRKKGRDKGVLVDFGCGTGRFLRFFARKGYSVIGTEITVEMLHEARRFGIPERCKVILTDGVYLPISDESVDMIWICGVLKYSLFVNPFQVFELQDDPAYPTIAREMYRVLKPGGLVVNVEIFVDVSPELFTRDFEGVGFNTKHARILHRYESRLERVCEDPRLPLRWVVAVGQLGAALHFWFDDARNSETGLRDYLFVWRKPTG